MEQNIVCIFAALLTMALIIHVLILPYFKGGIRPESHLIHTLSCLFHCMVVFVLLLYLSTMFPDVSFTFGYIPLFLLSPFVRVVHYLINMENNNRKDVEDISASILVSGIFLVFITIWCLRSIIGNLTTILQTNTTVEQNVLCIFAAVLTMALLVHLLLLPSFVEIDNQDKYAILHIITCLMHCIVLFMFLLHISTMFKHISFISGYIPLCLLDPLVGLIHHLIKPDARRKHDY